MDRARRFALFAIEQASPRVVLLENVHGLTGLFARLPDTGAWCISVSPSIAVGILGDLFVAERQAGIDAGRGVREDRARQVEL